MRLKEHMIQEQIIKYCKAKDIFVLSIPNEGNRTFAEIQALKKMGLYKGASDLIVWLDKTAIFIEVKDESNNQTVNQKKFQEDVESRGFSYYLVRSLEDFKIALDNSNY